MDPLDFEATDTALHEGVAGRVVARDVIVVSGPDALSYLQGQCSQDVAALGIGESAEALLLSVQGKLEAYVRVVRAGDELVYVDLEHGYGETALERLGRFKVRVKATLELRTWQLAEVRGPVAAAILAGLAPAEGVFAIGVEWPGYRGFDLLGETVGLPGGVAPGDDAAFETARIEAGVPRMGAELTERTIAPEAGIVGRTVSFTKGCYTGQELIARLDARGNRVPWRLRQVIVEDPEPAGLAPGDALIVGSKEVGTLTSVAFSPRLRATVALAYLRRDAAPPLSVTVRSASGEHAARVEALPGSDD